MTQEQFLYWLKGYIELSGKTDSDWKAISEKLNEVIGYPNKLPTDPFLFDPRLKESKKYD